MSKALVITVAGTSTRFRKSVGFDVLKCLYSASPHHSILHRILSMGIKNSFQKIIVVGGYRFSDLKQYLDSFSSNGTELSLLYNDKFNILGSNFSLYMGLQEALQDKSIKKVIFTEGDLIFDDPTFSGICNSSNDVITSNSHKIAADKAVVFYTDLNNKIKYSYDPDHRLFQVKEPFFSIFNSGQMWSFSNTGKLKSILEDLHANDLQDTNLNIVQKYFDCKQLSDIEHLTFKEWFNCNTVQDYEEASNVIEL